MPTCASCGQESPAGFAFCGRCGAALTERRRPQEVRKTITVLFSDVSGSTALGERLDPEALRHVMERYFEEIRAVVERHGGTVEKFIGDAVMAVWGVPQVREDDALRAVRAAAEIRERLPLVADELGVALTFRTGVNTGRVVVGAGATLATGDAVNVAARLEQAAAPGEILIGGETRHLVRDAVEVEPIELSLKGKDEPVEAFRLKSLDPAAPGVARRLDAPLVGRERELGLLRQAYERVVVERGCHLVTLLGAAGVGKSRLVAELIDELGDDATVLRGRCLPYGEGITFWPLVEALVQIGEPAAAVLEHVVDGGASSAQELFWEVRKLLETVAATRPLVAVFDDLHWAEPMLFDLLDHVADLSRDAPIMLLCVARPEILEERSGWGAGKLNATSALLEPLDAAGCEELLDSLGHGIDDAARQRIVTLCEGNPLFLEETVAFLDDGGQEEVPPTIQALVSARLERLTVGERAVLEAAAVEGTGFHVGAVRELAPEAEWPLIDGHLASLTRKELIRPQSASLAGQEGFRFRHILIRDAAYEAVSKEARANLHERFAGWLERHGPELVELDEIVGWHLQQAARYREELGMTTATQVAARGSEHLATAGRRAQARLDVVAAENLLTRALALLPPGDERRPRIALELAEASIPRGRLDQVERLLDEAAADPSLDGDATLLRLDWLLQVDPEEAVRRTAIEVPGVIESFRAADDDRGLAKAHMALFHAHWFSASAGLADKDLALAAEHARRAGDRGLLTQAVGWMDAPLIWGPADPETIRRRIRELEGLDVGPFAQSGFELTHAFIARMEGRFEDAYAHCHEAERIYTEIGHDVLRLALRGYIAELAMAEGRHDKAIPMLRDAYDELGRIGERGYRPTIGASLAEALYRAGDRDEAERVAVAVEAESAPADVINFVTARAVLARIRADAGELAEAEELARSAGEFALRTDFPLMQAAATAALATVLAAAGRSAEADDQFARAIELHEGKGDRVGAERIRAQREDAREGNGQQGASLTP